MDVYASTHDFHQEAQQHLTQKCPLETERERETDGTDVLTDRVSAWHALHTSKEKKKLCPSPMHAKGFESLVVAFQTVFSLQSWRSVPRHDVFTTLLMYGLRILLSAVQNRQLTGCQKDPLVIT